MPSHTESTLDDEARLARDQMPGGVRVAVVGLVFALPLAGALAAGRTLAEFIAFPPPLAIPDGYVRFSSLSAAAVAVLLVAVVLPWLFVNPKPALADGRSTPAPKQRRIFPAWGWGAVLWTGGWWVLAWARFPWFEPLQLYTFFPLWIGFIVAVNAAIEQRTGTCLLRRAPRRWLALFAISAVCWWGFEWLNRFARNWHYLNAEEFGALGYLVHATVCFSTVLPAVAAVAEWLASFDGWEARVASGPAWSWLPRRGTALALALFGAASLFATGWWPEWFYPALWVSPLALLLAAPALLRRSGLANEIGRGDWRRAATWMIAALMCGFFWELWNWHSLAKWIYTVPGVERWHLFEMPALGYAGYLPFGLECLLVAEWVIGDRWSPQTPASRRP